MKTPLKAILIEDSRDDLDLLAATLGREFDLDYRQAQTSDELKSLLEHGDWSAVISDYSLPRFNGMEALKIVREKNRHLPFFMVSGTIGEFLAVEAMRAGAHDYVMKDNLLRLLPAIHRELEELSTRLKMEAELKQKEEQLIQAQKMEAIGNLAGGIAHDFNNFLAVILIASENLQSKVAPKHPAWEDLVHIQEAVQKAATLTRQLLTFSRRQIGKPRAVDMNSVIEQTQKLVGRLLGDQFTFNIDLQPNLPNVMIDPVQLEQVVMNLLTNARDAMPDGGEIDIKTSKVTITTPPAKPEPPAGPRQFTVLTIKDNGCGMSEEIKARIFEPFFTTKGPEVGTGLGLATVFGIIKQAGGHIDVLSTPGKGSEFRIYLPATEKKAKKAPEPAPVEKAEEADKGRTVLLVEDQIELRRTLKDTLRKAGFNVISADSARDATLVEQSHPEPIELLLTDLVLPDRNGVDLAQSLIQKRPDMEIIVMSGYLDERLMRTKFDSANFTFLHKPFTNEDLLARIDQVLGKMTHKEKKK